MRLLLILFCSLLSLSAKAQISPDKYVYDHGNIEKFNNDTAYFTFTNSSAKSIYLLTTQPSGDYEILIPSKTIEPNSTWTIGIIYYTGQKGKFSVKIPLYFSALANPITLEVKGNIKSITETALTTCPSIENSKPLAAAQVPLNIIVKDAETQETLSNVDVKAKQKNMEYTCVTGLNSKTFRCKVVYGNINITAQKKNYETQTVNYLYDPINYTCIIELKKKAIIEDTLTEPEKPEIVVIKEKPIDQTKTKEQPKQPEIAVQENKTDTFKQPEYIYIPSSVADSGFNSYRYKPNHLIFIIDISGSMKDSGKLDYLKTSMKKLIASVRPQDHITLITYNSKVKVVFSNYSGIDRNAMYKAIDTMSAKGGSNGAMSIQMAYDLAKMYYIKGGNNQIFLATDGLFNSSKISDEDLYKMAAKYALFNNIKLSSIGFGKDEKALSFLNKLSKFGKGNFLMIKHIPTDIDVLIEEVKTQSLSK